jgi:hypothetical protein
VGVVLCGVLLAVLVGLMASVGFGFVALCLVLALGVTVFTLARPEDMALVMAALLPFLVVPFRVGDFGMFLGLPLGILVGGSLLLRCWGSGSWRPPRLLGPLLLAFLCLMFVSSVFSGYPSRGISRCISIATFTIFAWGLGTAIASGRLSARKLALAFLLGATAAGVALTAQSLAQFVVGEARVTDWLRDVQMLFQGREGGGRSWVAQGPDTLRAVFPFMVAASAGQYCGMGMVVALYFLRSREPEDQEGPPRLLFLVAFAILTVALLLTFSRQAWIGVSVALVILLLRDRGAVLLAACVPLLLVAAVAPLPGGGGTVGGYLMDLRDTDSGSTRMEFWRGAIEYGQARPGLGIGPGQYQILSSDPTHAFYAHNVYLDQLVEVGLPAALIFTALVLALLAKAWRSGATLALGMMLVFAVSNIFDDILYFPRNGLALAIGVALLGVAQLPRAARQDDPGPPPVPAVPEPVRGPPEPRRQLTPA